MMMMMIMIFVHPSNFEPRSGSQEGAGEHPGGNQGKGNNAP